MIVRCSSRSTSSTRPQKMHWFLWANVIGMVYNLKAILLGGLTGNERVDVAVGQGGGANYIAMIMSMSLPFLYLRVLNAKGFERFVAIVLRRLYVFAIVRHRFARRLPEPPRAVGLYLLFRSNRKLLGARSSWRASRSSSSLVDPRARASSASTRGSGVEGKRDRSAESRLQLWSAAMDDVRGAPDDGRRNRQLHDLLAALRGLFRERQGRGRLRARQPSAAGSWPIRPGSRRWPKAAS